MKQQWHSRRRKRRRIPSSFSLDRHHLGKSISSSKGEVSKWFYNNDRIALQSAFAVGSKEEASEATPPSTKPSSNNNRADRPIDFIVSCCVFPLLPCTWDRFSRIKGRTWECRLCLLRPGYIRHLVGHLKFDTNEQVVLLLRGKRGSGIRNKRDHDEHKRKSSAGRRASPTTCLPQCLSVQTASDSVCYTKPLHSRSGGEENDDVNGNSLPWYGGIRRSCTRVNVGSPSFVVHRCIWSGWWWRRRRRTGVKLSV